MALTHKEAQALVNAFEYREFLTKLLRNIEERIPATVKLDASIEYGGYIYTFESTREYLRDYYRFKIRDAEQHIQKLGGEV